MAVGWDRLQVRGDGEPITPAEIDGWVQANKRDLPNPVREVLEKFGAGWLLGVYEVPAPASGAWATWQARAEERRRRGYFTGLTEHQWQHCFIFAADRRGNALGCVRKVELYTFFLLTTAGSVFEIARSVDEFLDALPELCTQTFDVEIPPSVVDRFGLWETREPTLDLGIERCWVRGPETTIAWLEALSSGGDTDGTLERALGSEPLMLAYVHLLAAVCGPAGDTVPETAREEAVGTLLRLAQRRERPLLPTIVPELERASDWNSPAVRRWAEAPTRFDLPIGSVRDEADVRGAVVEPVDDSLRPELDGPWFDEPRQTLHWFEAWTRSHEERRAARILYDRCLAIAPGERFSIVRQINQLSYASSSQRPRLPGNWANIDQLRTRIIRCLEANSAVARPLVLLGLRTLDGVGIPLLPLLREDLSNEKAALLLALVEHPNNPNSEYDTAYYAGAYLETFTPDNDVVSRFLPFLDRPMLRGSGPYCDQPTLPNGPVSLLAARIDLDEVYHSLLRCFAMASSIIGPALVRRPGRETIAVLKKHLKPQNRSRRFALLHVQMDAARALIALGDPAGPPALERCNRVLDRM
jgi:hypothetical protein